MRFVILILIANVAAGGASADPIRLFSYDPADAATRAAAGPMTFQFRQGLLHATIMNLRSTEAEATVDLHRASESELGGRGLGSLIGALAAQHDLYAVDPGREGGALIAALCPGSTRAWMAIGHPRFGRDLNAEVLGGTNKGAAHLCTRLSFNFHGEWRAPEHGKYDTTPPPERRGPQL